MRVLSNRLVLILLLLVTLAIGVLLVTPLAIKHYTVKWLEENGGDQVSFEDVDLNPFSGKLLLKGLDINVDNKTTLSFRTAALELAWLPLWHKQIEVKAVELNDLTILVQQTPDHTLVGGIRLPARRADTAAQSVAENPWAAGIDTLVLNNIRIHYTDDRLDLVLNLDHLQLDKLAQWSEETPAPVSASGSLNKASFTLSGKITPLAAMPRYDVTLKLDSLPLAAFETLLNEQSGKLSGELSYDGTLGYQHAADGYEIRQDGRLQVQKFDVILKQPALAISGSDSQAASQLTLAVVGNERQLQLKSDIDLADLDVNAATGRLQLLHSTSVKLTGLNMAAIDRLSVASLEAENIEFARRTETAGQAVPVDIDRLKLGSLAFADKLLSIDRVDVTGARRQFVRDTKGRWVINTIIDDIKRLGTTAQPVGKPPADKTGGAAVPAMAVAIGRIEIAGDSAVSLLDQSLDPPLQTNINIKSLLLESLDSGKPDNKTTVKLDAGIGKRTRLSLQGEIQPFLKKPGMDINSTLSTLDLPPLSPYAQAAMGLELDSGTLDADINVTTDVNGLDGLVKMKLYQLEVKTVESDHGLQSKLPVPVNVALDTLRDSNNTIALDIQIKGDPSNPDFNFDDALTQALAYGMQKGALTYLTMALQPYGSIIMAAKYAGEALRKVRLNPVGFAAGQDSLDDTARDYLSKVAGVLKERPQLAVKVCGVAVMKDRAYLQQQAALPQKPGDAGDKKEAPPAAEISDAQLRTLAQARAGSVRNYLVDSFKTPASRLVSCQPRLESGESAESTPRTDLLL